MLDLLRRYFIANTAPIFRITRTQLASSFVRTRSGNADGFYWGNWQVMWRVPYADVWAFDGIRWVPAYSLKPETDHAG